MKEAMIRPVMIAVGLLGLVPQAPPPRLTGDWQARTGDEIRHIMVRAHSSAQFGRDLPRWPVVGDSLWITLGAGVWQGYGLKVAGGKLTIRRCGLAEPVQLP